jgi:hypothetical protein
MLSNFIDTKKMPVNDTINELKTLYLDMNKGHMISSLSKETKEKMLSYKERKKILDTLIIRVVEKYGITNYEIRDEYGLNSVMNKVIELNDAKNMRTIEETLLPFIVQV